MQREQIKELLTHEMGDLLYAEQRFLTTTRQMAREAIEPALKERVERHVTETERQIERLKQAFSLIGERAKAERCDGALGIKAEHDNFKKEEKPDKEMLAAFALGSGLRVEHYEIAGYQSAITLARVLGEKECMELLQESLREEMDMAKFLEKNSQRALLSMLTPDGASRSENGGARKSGGASKSGGGSKAAGGRKSGGASKRSTAGAKK